MWAAWLSCLPPLCCRIAQTPNPLDCLLALIILQSTQCVCTNTLDQVEHQSSALLSPGDVFYPDPAWDAPNLTEHSSQLPKLAPGRLGSQRGEPVKAGAVGRASGHEWWEGRECGGELAEELSESLAVVRLDDRSGRERAGERRKDRNHRLIKLFRVGQGRAEGVVGDVV